MITLSGIKKLKSHPKYARTAEWGRMLTIVGSGQAVVQGLGLITGILIVRLLSVQEYALYTLANTMLGTMTLLADSGISTGVMAEGGKVWQDKEQLGKVISTGLYLRRRFAILSLLVSAPILMYLLLKHDATWPISLLIVLALIPAFFAALSDSLLEVAPKLKQDIIPLQKNQISANIGRLILQTAGLFFFPFTWVALLGNGLPRTYANFRLKKISSAYVNFNQKPDPAIKKQILKVVKRILPGAIYYCIVGQVTIFIISIFGSTTAVAHVGALNRLTTILTVVTMMSSTIIEPRFARLPNNAKILRSRFISIQVILLLLSAFILGLVWLFPDQITSILGSEYKGLHTEVLLLTLSSCLSLVSGSTYKISSSRGIVPPPAILIPFLIVVQVVFFFTVDYTQVIGALLFSVFTYTSTWLFRMIYFFIWIKKK